MAKLGFFAAVAAIVGALMLTNISAPAAGPPCATKVFKTQLIGDACKKGGQDEAKKKMKVFLSIVKERDPTAKCLTCHAKLAPSYERNKDALRLFTEAGGK